MTINQAWMLKGWLLGANPPPEIMVAMNAVIEELSGNANITHRLEQPKSSVSPADEFQDEPVSKPEKKRHNWSPEARAAQADRMRARQAAGLMSKRKSETTPPGEAEAPLQGGAQRRTR